MGEDWKGGFSIALVMGLSLIWQAGLAGVPAPTNMAVSPYRFLSDNRILIGELDGENA